MKIHAENIHIHDYVTFKKVTEVAYTLCVVLLRPSNFHCHRDGWI